MSWAVVLFKAPGDSDADDKFVDYLKCRLIGVHVTQIGVLAFEFFGFDELFEALANPDQYYGLIFASPRCVESIRRCVESTERSKVTWEHEFKVKWASKKVFCVGPSTATEAGALLGVQSDTLTVSQVGTAADLGNVIVADSSPNPTPLLYPGGTLQRDTLRGILTSGGVPFDSKTVYRTVENPQLSRKLTEFQKERTIAEKRIFVFFSPSGFNFVSTHITSLESIHLVAIGPTTCSELEKVVDVNIMKLHKCSSPTPEGLYDLIKTIVKS